MALAEGKSRVTITLGDEVLKKLDAYCARTGMTKSGYISYVVANNLDQQERLSSAVVDSLAPVFKDFIESQGSSEMPL